MDAIFPPHIRCGALQSNLHPEDVRSSTSNRAELPLLIFLTTSSVAFELHTIQPERVVSPLLCSGTPLHYI